MMVRAPLLAALLLRLSGANGQQQYGMFFGCPCPMGARDSAECTSCLTARCNVGGGVFDRECNSHDWCLKASTAWRKQCPSVASTAADDRSAAEWCKIVNPCPSACVYPAGTDCLAICTKVKGLAVGACEAFPWPVEASYTWPQAAHVV
mmetsp:Transcript_68369/g.198157  ORF Transcript_68369/g.198157 Transcript_68369/m.198157 type:complete len:149 (+) Transcript_68369:70-516(+)